MAITLTGCRCWYKGGYLVGANITFITSNPNYYYTEIKAIKFSGEIVVDTMRLGTFEPNQQRQSLTVEKEDAAMYHYIITIGDTLRRDTISAITLELKGPACDPEIKNFDFLYNGQNITGNEITLP